MLETKRDHDKRNTGAWNLPKVQLIYSTNDLYARERRKLRARWANCYEVARTICGNGAKSNVRYEARPW